MPLETCTAVQYKVQFIARVKLPAAENDDTATMLIVHVFTYMLDVRLARKATMEYASQTRVTHLLSSFSHKRTDL